MEILNNYIEIQTQLTNNSTDYFETYILEYFNITSLSQLNLSINYNVKVKTQQDIIDKYIKTFQTLDDKLSINSAFIKFNRILGNNTIYTIKNIHPKDIFYSNLWKLFEAYISDSLIIQFTTTYSTEISFLRNIILSNRPYSMYIYSYKPIVDFILNGMYVPDVLNKYNFILVASTLISKDFTFAQKDIKLNTNCTINYYNINKSFISSELSNIIKKGSYFKVILK